MSDTAYRRQFGVSPDMVVCPRCGARVAKLQYSNRDPISRHKSVVTGRPCRVAGNGGRDG